MLPPWLLRKFCVERIDIRIVDATGIPVVKLHRARYCRGFQRKSEVNFGYCAAKKTYYYGEKLHQKQNTRRAKKLLKLRSGIERIIEQLQDHMRIDETRARSQIGLETRIQSILTSFTFGLYFNMLCGKNILSLKSLVT